MRFLLLKILIITTGIMLIMTILILAAEEISHAFIFGLPISIYFVLLIFQLIESFESERR